jgi:hypothetical protein
MTKKGLLLVLLLIPVTGAVLYTAATGGLSPVLESVPDLTEDIDASLTHEIEVKTDKLQYGAGEPIVLTVKNLLSQDILTHLNSITPIVAIERVQRRNPEGKWERRFPRCQYPHCRYTEDGPKVLLPGKSLSFKWNPVFYVNGTSEQVRPTSGEYRVIVRYQLTRGSSASSWQRAASNEFTLRESY